LRYQLCRPRTGPSDRGCLYPEIRSTSDRDALLSLTGSANLGLAGCSGGGTEDTGDRHWDRGPAGADGDPDGEVDGLEGLGIELLEYDFSYYEETKLMQQGDIWDFE